MPPARSSRAASHAPLAVVILVLVLASRSPILAPAGALPLSVEVPGWGLIGLLAALYRPSGASRAPRAATLGLGTLALAPAVVRLGAVPATALACGVFLAAEVSRGILERRTTAGVGRRLVAAAARLAPVAGATLTAGAVIALGLGAAAVGDPGDPGCGPVDTLPLARQTLLPAAAYVPSFVVIALVGLRLSGSGGLGGGTGFWLLGLDAAGWWLGSLLTTAAPALGWGKVGLLEAAIAILAAEAARNAILRRASDQRFGNLERMRQAHVRLLGETSGMGGIAEQILTECRHVLPVAWFQLELAAETEGGDPPGDGERSWAAGPDAVLYPGSPQPPERPPVLPGVHRRTAWRILETPLLAEGETLATVRLWCDPRRVEPGAEELFTTLVPQMASSVHRARLDREARLDALTGVPVRRVLESRLQRAFRRCCEEGRSMAVIMCDVDFFKRINDTHGHAAGDRALALVARALESHRREDDICCRYGGEEFAVLVESGSGGGALRLAERLRRAVEALDLVFEGRRIPLTVSAGVAAFPELHIKTASELLLLADEALYEAKSRGRNRCLLNLGQGMFRAPSGPPLRSAPPPEPRLPRIFG